MTKQPTNTPQQSLRFLIANDSYAMGFQTVGQYRSTLLQIIDGINREHQAGIVEIVAAGTPPAPGIDLSGLVRYDFVGLDGGGEQFVQVDTAGYYIAHEVETIVALTAREQLVDDNASRAPEAPKLAHGHRDDYYLLANGRRLGLEPISRVRSMPNWVLAMELFATGSTSAHQICRDAGIDPDSTTIQRATAPKGGVA